MRIFPRMTANGMYYVGGIFSGIGLAFLSLTRRSRGEPDTVAVALNVKDDPNLVLRPLLTAWLELNCEDAVGVGSVSLVWDKGRQTLHSHMEDADTKLECWLTNETPRARFIFQRCSPEALSKALKHGDLKLVVSSSSESGSPIYVAQRHQIEAEIRQWLAELNRYYEQHAYDRSDPEPEPESVVMMRSSAS